MRIMSELNGRGEVDDVSFSCAKRLLLSGLPKAVSCVGLCVQNGCKTCCGIGCVRCSSRRQEQLLTLSGL